MPRFRRSTPADRTDTVRTQALLAQPWDVVVVGGGNAALVSAMTARDAGARVLVLERAERQFRGGNSRHTRNIRCVHDDESHWNTGAYSETELWDDLCGVGTGPSDEELARLTVRETESVPAWMVAHGATFQPALTGTLHLGRTNTFFLGGGKALLNSYYRRVLGSGISVVYEARVAELEFDGDNCTAVLVNFDGALHRVEGTSFVFASGGFEANIDWLARYWGPAASNYHIRGPRTNDGIVLRQLLDAGAETAGEEKGFHAVAVDARSPKFDGGLATRLDCIPFGIAVGSDGQRFYDEGEDIWPKRYAIWGGNIARQPDQIAYCLWDSKVQGLFLPPMYGVFRADSIAELAVQLGLDPDRVGATVRAFNAGTDAVASTRFDPAKLDGLTTSGVNPPKTNWAQPIDTPPYYGVAMRPGITFTYLGVRITQDARVVRRDGSRFANVFAAGEIMSGNILSTGYLAGFGMSIGTVWGRIAGRTAARHATD